MAEIRALAPGDEDLVCSLGEERALSREAAERLLADDAVSYLVAFEAGEPVGHALCYVLNRRRLPERSLFVYDVEVDEGLAPPRRRLRADGGGGRGPRGAGARSRRGRNPGRGRRRHDRLPIRLRRRRHGARRP